MTLKPIHLMISLLLLLLSIGGATAQDGLVYEDPHGRFSVPLGEYFELITLTDNYGQFQYTQAPTIVTLTAITLTEEIPNIEDAVRVGFESIGMPVASLIAGAGQGGWDLFVFQLANGQNGAAAARVSGNAGVCCY